MATYNRQSVLASFGNLAVAAAGREIYPVDSDFPNVASGEIFIESGGFTIDVGDIPTAQNIKIGVGVGPKNGNATSVRYLGGEDINLCNSTIAPRVTSPVCGTEQSMDFFFAGCIDCGEALSIAINLDDSYVRSNFSENEKISYNFTSVPSCCDTCASCENSADIDSLICDLVDKINRRTQLDPTKLTRFVHSGAAQQYQPFTASKLYLTTLLGSNNTTRIFCLEPSDDGCTTCGNLVGIKGISIDGAETYFNGTLDPNDNTISHHEHIKSIVKQINKALDSTGGHAAVKHGVGKCCNYTIEINSCADNILLLTNDGEGGTLSPCESTNPFTTQTLESVCRGCGVEPNTVSPLGGIRIHVDPLELHCPCDLPPLFNTPNYYGRTVTVEAVGNNWKCHSFFTNESTAQVLPEGLGYYWKDKAYLGNHRGGAGRDFRYNNVYRGRFNYPDQFSRATNAASGIQCDESYCVYNMLITDPQQRFFNNATYNVNTSVDWLLIPSGDSVTKASWEPILAALQARSICQAGDINCS